MTREQYDYLNQVLDSDIGAPLPPAPTPAPTPAKSSSLGTAFLILGGVAASVVAFGYFYGKSDREREADIRRYGYNERLHG